jgi:hypothetical protein
LGFLTRAGRTRHRTPESSADPPATGGRRRSAFGRGEGYTTNCGSPLAPPPDAGQWSSAKYWMCCQSRVTARPHHTTAATSRPLPPQVSGDALVSPPRNLSHPTELRLRLGYGTKGTALAGGHGLLSRCAALCNASASEAASPRENLAR